MIVSEGYKLLDFGDRRKLERFGNFLIDRPSPAAESVKKNNPKLWKTANYRFEIESGHQGHWFSEIEEKVSAMWLWKCLSGTFQLKLTPFGHIGIFPEQIENWKWIASLGKKLVGLKILNLFAYTGGSTIALANCGAQVVHVDSASNVVGWARKNAEYSSLTAAPIRWIVEDAMRFVAREIKRGNKYDGFVADPPTFGRGPKRERWSIQTGFTQLLKGLMTLTDHSPRFGLISNHSPGFEGSYMCKSIQEVAIQDLNVKSVPMRINESPRNFLNSGHTARFFVESAI